MVVRVLADEEGTILRSEGDLDIPYGIASLSKVWSAFLLQERMKAEAAQKSVPFQAILGESLKVATDYENKAYRRQEHRADLAPPDDPLIYRPFRADKARFRLPVEKGRAYRVQTLLEAMLFESRNDAAQLLADRFFGDFENTAFREASTGLAYRLGLNATRIGDPHGLCDGDNVATAREWTRFGAALFREGFLDFYELFDLYGWKHTAQTLFDDSRLAAAGIRILFAKTGCGNDRRGDEEAQHLMALAQTPRGKRMVFVFSDPLRFENAVTWLLSA